MRIVEDKENGVNIDYISTEVDLHAVSILAKIPEARRRIFYEVEAWKLEYANEINQFNESIGDVDIDFLNGRVKEFDEFELNRTLNRWDKIKLDIQKLRAPEVQPVVVLDWIFELEIYCKDDDWFSDNMHAVWGELGKSLHLMDDSASNIRYKQTKTNWINEILNYFPGRLWLQDSLKSLFEQLKSEREELLNVS